MTTLRMMASSNGNIFRVSGPWRGALMFSLICAWTNGWANYQDAGDLRRHHTHYDVTVMGPVYMWGTDWLGRLTCNNVFKYHSFSFIIDKTSLSSRTSFSCFVVKFFIKMNYSRKKTTNWYHQVYNVNEYINVRNHTYRMSFLSLLMYTLLQWLFFSNHPK